MSKSEKNVEKQIVPETIFVEREGETFAFALDKEVGTYISKSAMDRILKNFNEFVDKVLEERARHDKEQAE